MDWTDTSNGDLESRQEQVKDNLASCREVVRAELWGCREGQGVLSLADRAGRWLRGLSPKEAECVSPEAGLANWSRHAVGETDLGAGHGHEPGRGRRCCRAAAA